MALIKHSELRDFLDPKNTPAPVYLIFGEPFLYQKAFKELVDTLVPEDRQSFSLDVLDGSEENLYEAIERLNTFSLDAMGPRVVGFRDARIFYSKTDSGKLVRQIKTAVAENAPQKGAARFMKLLSLLGIDPENIGDREKQQILDTDPDKTDEDAKWLDTIIDFCRHSPASETSAADPSAVLQKAIENGFAPGSHLVITTDVVDKRRKLFKTISENGHIIDCSVPQGDSRAARDAQRAALAELEKSVLKPLGKKLKPDAFKSLFELTGFDPGTFQNNLEKLASYTSGRETITAEDVRQLLHRTRTDPIYELTNALFAKDTAGALFYLDSLLGGAQAAHPLQVLAAILNQVRKLLIIRDFMESENGRDWRSGMRFDAFQRQLKSAIEKYDAATAEQAEYQEQILNQSPQKGKSSKKHQPPAELVIAPNIKSLYPVYKNFEKADNFSMKELLAIFRDLEKNEHQLKRTSETAAKSRYLLEQLVVHITRSHYCPA